LEILAGQFGIDVQGVSILSNHFHLAFPSAVGSTFHARVLRVVGRRRSAN
jgi:hypothetical protein